MAADSGSIRYCSTRRDAAIEATEGISFVQAVLSGLAADGGLLLPERVPVVPSDELGRLRQLSYRDLFVRLLRLYITEAEIPIADLNRLVIESCAKFRVPDCVEYSQIAYDGRTVTFLELFHGPTFAFKDFALQFVGRLLEYILGAQKVHATVLAATSGDTGSAAIAAFEGSRNVSCCILFPEGKTSRIQELQMTANPAANVHCLAVQEATFDKCQAIVKTLFQSPLKHELQLTAVNSINWARILAQTVYYWHAALRSSTPIDIVVPTGNFGNALAALYAKLSGAPIRRIVTASNSNDALPRYAHTGVLEPRPVIQTMSPAMDIQIPSNLERGMYLEREQRLAGRQVGFTDLFLTLNATEAETQTVIRRCWDESKVLLDPHTAVGLHCALQYLQSPLRDEGAPVLVVATAHCGKFPEALSQIVGPEVAYSHVPAALRSLERLPQRKHSLTPTVGAVKDYLINAVRQNARAVVAEVQ